jgi:hypothetical protein
MAKKPFQQGRSEGKPEAYSMGYVEGLSEARTKPGKRRVSARRGGRVRRTGFYDILR